ncbi:PAS domain-containing protein [Desulfovibrio aerotolerans]|uniref:PAS domain-containing protein n=1 Tax=Solidesulfovibrio aerotolerans TaxID=295255 RepID=A0A7C9MFY8_9BACT|nr:PAS domain-containing protein [Solidesulfovibrio aerotolerans]MYL83850.1 PAS domain-containing protein [Solidesulfovibrio aerotolerans]
MKQTSENSTEKLQSVIEAVGSIINSICGPLAVLNSDLVVLKANESFYKLFKVTQLETEGKPLLGLGNQQLDCNNLQEFLQRALTTKSKFHSLDIAYKHASSELTTMRLSARVVHKTDIHTQLIIISAEDITHIEQNKVNDRLITKERTQDLVAARHYCPAKKRLDA